MSADRHIPRGKARAVMSPVNDPGARRDTLAIAAPPIAGSILGSFVAVGGAEWAATSASASVVAFTVFLCSLLLTELGITYAGSRRGLSLHDGAVHFSGGRLPLDELAGIEIIDLGSGRRRASLLILLPTEQRSPIGAGPFDPKDARSFVTTAARLAPPRPTARMAPGSWFFSKGLCASGAWALLSTALVAFPVPVFLALIAGTAAFTIGICATSLFPIRRGTASVTLAHWNAARPQEEPLGYRDGE